MLLNYHPVNADVNYGIIKAVIGDHGGRVERIGKVRVVVKGLADKPKAAMIDRLMQAIPNLEVEDKGDRLVIRTAFKKNQVGFLDEIPWAGTSKHVVPPKDKALEVALGQKRLDGGLEGIRLLFNRLDRKLSLLQHDKQVEGVRELIQEAENAADAIEWAKLIDQEKRLSGIRKRIKPVLQQLMVAPPKLRTVNDNGASSWEQQLENQIRVKAIRERLDPVLDQLRGLRRARKRVASERVQEIRHAIRGVLRDIKAFGGPHLLKSVDQGALKWAAQLEDDPRCARWREDKAHNPFNPTNRGRRIREGGPVFREVSARCDNPASFCSKTKDPKIISKYCS